jgi:hypothetical protein
VHNVNRLPCATYPRPDELLSSWLTRMAHDHLLKTHTFGKMLFPGANVWNTDLDRSAPESMLHTLAIRTGTPLDRVEQTVLRRYEGRLHLHSGQSSIVPWILPLGIYHRTRRYNGLLFCPLCLQKDGLVPYFRTHWRLAVTHVCTRCGVYLQDRCPECEHPVIFFRVELGRKSELANEPISHCFHCGLNLAKVPVEYAPAPVLADQLELERILREGWNEQIFHPHLYFIVLRQLMKQLINARPASKAFQQAVDKETGWSPVGEDFRIRMEKVSIELLPLRVRGGVLRQAQWLLTDWPERFLEMAGRYPITSTPFLYAMTDIPFWFQNVVVGNLYVGRYFQTFLPKKKLGWFSETKH